MADIISEASFRIVPHTETAFGVEVSKPDSQPTIVTSFATEADAEAWIANYKVRVEESKGRKKWGRRPSNPAYANQAPKPAVEAAEPVEPAATEAAS